MRGSVPEGSRAPRLLAQNGLLAPGSASSPGTVEAVSGAAPALLGLESKEEVTEDPEHALRLAA